MRSVGVYLTDLLARYGVDTIFGIPGVHTAELYRGLTGSPIRHVTPRHEQGAGFMADGYARASGKPGVCFVITGPGLTNALTAMGQAYADSVPMLVISSVNARGAIGSGDGFLHELSDQRRMASAVTAFSHTVTSARELPQVIARAFAVFAAARPRPVHIELPLDIIAAPADGLVLPGRVPLCARPVASAGGIDLAAEWLSAATAPVIFAGGGAVAAAEVVRALAERIDAPVVMTINGRGILPPGHPLGVSVSPSFPAVRALAAAADVVLAVGTEMGPTDYDNYATGGMPAPRRLIRIDIDPEQAMRNFAADLALIGDADLTLAALLQRLGGGVIRRDGRTRAQRTQAEGIAELDTGTQRDIAFLTTLRNALPDAIIVGDSTRQVYAGNAGFAASRPGSWFNAATGFGALGYGLPAAIGTALAQPGRPVVCLIGDGGLQFSLAELGAAVEAGVRIIVVLLNNGGYREIKQYMQQRGITPIGVDLVTPDFQRLARAFGWHAERLRGPDTLHDALSDAAARSLPSLIEWRDPPARKKPAKYRLTGRVPRRGGQYWPACRRRAVAPAPLPVATMAEPTLVLAHEPPFRDMPPVVLPRPKREVRNFGLDLARVLACTLVLASHWNSIFAPLYGSQPSVPLVLGAYFGVELFFVLSGFLIGGLLIRIADTDPTVHGWFIFMVRRWMRTLPLYWLWLGVLPLVLAVPADFRHRLLVFATMTQNLAWPMPADNWFNASWSLTVEEWFYLSFSAALVLAVAATGARRSIWAVILLFLAGPAIARHYQPATANFEHDIFHVVVLRLDAIAYGVALARLQAGGSRLFRHPILAFVLGCAIVGAFWVQASTHIWLPVSGPVYMQIQLIAGSIGLCLLLAGLSRLRSPSRPIAWLVAWGSRLSYGVYIMHLTIIEAVAAYFVDHEGTSDLIVETSAALILLLPLLSYVLFEGPLMALRPRQRPARARGLALAEEVPAMGSR